MPYDVFISYASEDIAFAQELNDRLVNEGFKVWFDRARLAPGFDWYKDIEQGCENSRVLLPVMTPRWKISEWTKYETYGAEAVIPILLEGSWIDVATPPLERFQAEIIEINKQGGADWSRLISDIRRVRDSQLPEKATHLTHIQYRANEYFTGREKELLNIHEELHSKPKAGLTSGRVRAITAMGGAGKTTLVRQYVEKFWRCYPQIFWVDCRIGMENEFALIHDVLFPERKNIGIKDADKAASALHELNGNVTRLLILDNADDLEELILDWIPIIGACHTLVTSRYSAFGGAIKTIHIFLLEEEPSVEFFKKRCGRELDGIELNACKTLAKELGYLPLALEQAAAYIEQQGEYFGFRDYLQLYFIALKDCLNIKTSGSTRYPESVFATWKSTIAKLSNKSRAILHLSSYLASIPISVEQLVKISDIIREHAENFYGDNSPEPQINFPITWVRSELAQLKAYSMIQFDGLNFTMHPLLQVVERLTDKKEEYGITMKHVTAIIEKLSPLASWEEDSRKLFTVSNDQQWAQVLSHVNRLEQVHLEFDDTVKSELFLKLSMNAYASQDHIDKAYNVCLPLFDSLKQKHDTDEQEYLQVLKALAYLQKKKGMNNEALQSFTELNHIRAELYGVESPLALKAQHVMSVLLQLLNRTDEAEKLMNKVLTIQKRVLGEDNYDTITSIHNVGWLLSYSEMRWEESEPYYRKAYEYWKKTVGLEILDTRIAAENLANLLHKKGDSIQAEQIQRDLLIGSETVLGKEHVDCIGIKNNLVYYLCSNGKQEEALQLISEVVAGYRQALPPDDFRMLNALNDWGTLLIRSKRYTEAEPLLKEALDGYDRKQDFETHGKLKIIETLAVLLKEIGRPEEARSLQLRIINAAISKDDITPIELRQAASDCVAIGAYQEAESILNRVLSLEYEVSGIHCHLARICLLTNRLPDAEKHVQEAWFRRSEAPDYVIARILWFNLAFSFIRGKPETKYTGLLKSVIQKELPFMGWTMQAVLDILKPQITEQQNAFLKTLLEALSDKQNLDKLNDFPEWKEAIPETLD